MIAAMRALKSSSDSTGRFMVSAVALRASRELCTIVLHTASLGTVAAAIWEPERVSKREIRAIRTLAGLF